MPITCPACGSSKESGKFCSQCGGSLQESTKCAECGNPIPKGGRFCNMCGVPVVAAKPVVKGETAGRPGLSRNVPWFIAGAALLALIVLLVAPRFTSSDAPPPAAPPLTGPAPVAGTPPDLSTMTANDAALRLYNRVMQTLSAGDTAQALAFAPMAISAYEMVDPIDLDGLYHKAVLELVANQPEAARETANRILNDVPNHLLGLFTAAQAENMLGNTEEAGALYARFLENYDAELAQSRPEYTEHEPAFPSMREEAEELATVP